MIVLASLSLLLSAATCYAIGYAIIAPRDAWVRTKLGITVLIIAALSFIVLPPQLLGLESAADSLSSVSAGLADALVWPAALSKGVFVAIWVLTSLAGLLIGMQIWNVGKSGWRASVNSSAYDTSKTGRMRALIVMADSLAEVLDIMARMGADAKSTQGLADELSSAGRRFASEIPASPADAYRMVSAAVGPEAASVATRLLLEGAGRTGVAPAPR